MLDNLRMTFDEEAIPDEIPTAHTLDAHGCVFAQGLFPLRRQRVRCGMWDGRQESRWV